MPLDLKLVPDDELPAPAPESVSGKVLLQPSVRTLQTWTPAQVRQAASSADAGYIGQAAELADHLLADDRVGDSIEARTGGLQGLPLSFVDGRGDEPGESPLAGDLTGDWWEMFPETEVKQLQAWGIVLGVGFAQQVWRVNGAGRFAPFLDVWHPRHFEWSAQIRRWQVRTVDSGLITIEPDDAKWIVYTPYGVTRPWSRGLWRGLGLWWMLKQFAVSDWGLHGEQASRTVVQPLPTVAGAPRSSPDKSQRADLSSEIHNLGKDGVIVLPQGFEMKLIEATANTRDIYGAQIDAANMAMTLAVSGQNLTTQVDSGSRAAATVHERVEARRIRSDGETLATTLRDQSLAWWTLWNYTATTATPWPHWDTDPPEDKQNKATVFETAARAVKALADAGHEVVDLDEAAADMDIPRIKAAVSAGRGTATPSARGRGPAQPQARLASGLPVAQAKGFVEGQVYADTLADWGARLQAATNGGTQGFVARLIAALDDGASYSEIRELVLNVYRGEAPPEEAAEMIEALFIMANRAGQVAVDQDV